MDTKYIVYTVIGIFLATAGLGVATISPADNTQATVQSNDNTESINYVDHVYIYKNGELISKTENALMEGEAIIRNLSATGGNENFEYNYIALGNGNAPTDTSSSLDSEFSSANLSPRTSTYESIGSGTDDVEWNYSETFTADGTATVNTTAVKSTNAPSGIDYYAGASFGRDLNVVDGDKITVEWNFDPD